MNLSKKKFKIKKDINNLQKKIEHKQINIIEKENYHVFDDEPDIVG
jgi:hypothetical protein